MGTLGRLVAVLSGCAVGIWVLLAAVRTVVLPRGEPVLLTRWVFVGMRSVFKLFGRRAKTYEDRTFEAFEAAFGKQYDGERIPLQLGFHFVEMNDGAYWRALDRFVSDVCHRQDVACVSYSEAIPLIAARGKPQQG